MGDSEGILFGNFWNGPRLWESVGFLVEKREIEALVEADEDVVGSPKEDVTRSNRRVQTW